MAPIDKLSVVVAMMLAMAFLGEKRNLGDGIGAGVIVLGARSSSLGGSALLLIWIVSGAMQAAGQASKVRKPAY